MYRGLKNAKSEIEESRLCGGRVVVDGMDKEKEISQIICGARIECYTDAGNVLSVNLFTDVHSSVMLETQDRL